MNQLSPGEVSRLAQLARLALTADELDLMSKDLPRIVEFYQAIQSTSVDAAKVTKARSLETLRPDELGSGPEGITINELQQLAPEFDDGKRQVIVPAVFAND